MLRSPISDRPISGLGGEMDRIQLGTDLNSMGIIVLFPASLSLAGRGRFGPRWLRVGQLEASR